MKKTFNKILVFGLIICATMMNSFAQGDEIAQEKKDFNALEYRHELKLGVGFFAPISNYSTLSMYPSFISEKSLEDILLLGAMGSVPQFSVAYDYRACKAFAIGVEISSDFEMFHVAGVTMDFYYLCRPKFSFYGNLGLNAVWCTNYNANDQIFPTIGIYPIGLKFGNKAGGFIEVGFGHKGIVNFGAYLKLDKSKG